MENVLPLAALVTVLALPWRLVPTRRPVVRDYGSMPEDERTADWS